MDAYQVPPHRIDPYSFEARRSKAAVIVINAGIEFGDEDVAKFVKEQNSAKGNFPGPVPIVYRGVDVTKDTVLKAKELGVDGLALRGDQFDEAALTEIISELYKVNIEPFMEISDVSQIPIAVNAGARTMCVRFETDMMPKFLTKATLQMRDDIPKDCVAVGTVKARQGGAEIEQIRSLSDAGFHGVLLSQMVSDANEETALPYMKYIIAVYGVFAPSQPCFAPESHSFRFSRTALHRERCCFRARRVNLSRSTRLRVSSLSATALPLDLETQVRTSSEVHREYVAISTRC